MTYRELYSYIDKPWATVIDIQNISRCGRNKAYKVFREIEYKIKKQNKRIPETKQKIVPMSYVIEYFNIDIESIYKRINNKE